MSFVEFIVSLCIFAILIVGLTGYFVFRIMRMILNQRAAERLYLERVAAMRSRSEASAR